MKRALILFITATLIFMAILIEPKPLSATNGDEWSPHLQPKTARTLLYALPDSLPAEYPSLLKIEVLRDGRAVIRQTIELSAGLAEASVIELLAGYPKELAHLRKLESAHPGSIRLGLWLGDQHVEELSLRELEEEARRLTPLPQPTLGTTLQVDILAEGGLARIAEKAISECAQQCQDELNFCYEFRCDPRGSCEFCNEYYNSCMLSCPTTSCPSTRDYTVSTVVNASMTFFKYGCYWTVAYPSEAVTWDLWKYRYRFNKYRETTNCDGSKTTQLLSTTYSPYDTCLRKGGIPCGSPANLPVYPQLCPPF